MKRFWKFFLLVLNRKRVKTQAESEHAEITHDREIHEKRSPPAELNVILLDKFKAEIEPHLQVHSR